MAKKFSPFISWLIINLGTLFIRISGITWKFERLSPKPEQRIIYAFWHRNILPLMYLHRGEGNAVLISQSQDGEVIAQACEKFGYIAVRGSSRRGGGKATRELIKLAQNRTLGITPDGPKGPVGKFKEGIIFLAKATGLPIVLVTCDVSREITFKSWDRFRLPLLFCRIKVLYGSEIYIPRNADSESLLLVLEKEMTTLEEKIKIFDRIRA
ncbi:MAG: lysophospholipid acyltransferase family protein [Candidatus Cloacimonetes bacterium]|nr:lysophospholipid acyltransferase family protein [Candidatus Cloacimonadota bacterium]